MVRKLFDVQFANGWHASVIFVVARGCFEVMVSNMTIGADGEGSDLHGMSEHDDNIIRTSDPWHLGSILFRIMMLAKKY